MKSQIALLLVALVAGSALAAETKPAFKPDLAKGQAIASGACSACHSIDGSRGAPANPILAGQHPEYLAKQLQEFKSGKRKNAVMAGFASTPLSARPPRQMRSPRRMVSLFFAAPGLACLLA